MNRYDESRDRKHPPNRLLAPPARSVALRWFIGSLLMFFLLIGVALVFWSAANPRPSVLEQRDVYSTEGGHDPIRQPGSTRDELKFRGELTPPNGTPRR
jgi:hypothetical protein